MWIWVRQHSLIQGGLWIWVRQHPLIQRGGCLCYWGYATLFSFFHGLKTQLTLMQPH